MDGLHRIIKSLTKAEKRYFKLFASTFKDDTKLVKLFDVMDSFELENYTDEKAAKKSGIDSITSSKTKLRKLLLKAMRNFHEDTDDGISLRNGLSDIEFLIKKQLLTEAEKEHNKLKKYADELLAYEVLSQLDILYLTLAETQKTPEKSNELYNSLIANNSELTNTFREINIARIVHSKVIRYLNVFDFESPDLRELTIRKNIVEIAELSINTKSAIAKIFIFDSLQQCHNQLQETNKALQYGSQIQNTYFQNPALKKANWKFYFPVISNVLTSKIANNDFDNASILLTQIEKDVQEAESYLRNDTRLKNRINYRLFHSKVAVLHSQGNFGEFISLENDLAFWQEQTDYAIPAAHIQLTILRFVSAYYYSNQLQKAKKLLNHYFSLDVMKQVKLIYYIFRIFEIIILFDLKQLDLSEQKATNFYKILLDAELDNEVFKHIRTFLLRLNKWDFANKNTAIECQNWIQELNRIKESDNNVVHELYQFIDIGKWLAGKV